MTLPRFFAFYCLLILYFVNSSITFSIDYEKEMDEIKERLSAITDPKQREERLLRIAVENREEAVKERQRSDMFAEKIGSLEIKKNISDHNVKILAVPLVFRNYVYKIEDRFPTVTAVIPQNVVRNLKLHQGVLQRKYNWIEILSNDKFSKDVYVELIKPELKKKFFSRENIPIMTKEVKDLTEVEAAKYTYQFSRVVL